MLSVGHLILNPFERLVGSGRQLLHAVRAIADLSDQRRRGGAQRVMYVSLSQNAYYYPCEIKLTSSSPWQEFGAMTRCHQ